jgi:N-acetylneuraminic acid mutarotase
LDVSVLRWLKREMGFYCIELTVEPQEVAFVVGGSESDDKALASIVRYDVASNTWSKAAPMAIARSELGLCELDGELYATGGWGAGGASLASVERYDPSLDTWSTAPSMPWVRYSHCACTVGDSMYVLGGYEEIAEEEERNLSTVLKLDSQLQTWIEVAPMPAKHFAAGVCVVGSDIYIFGGLNYDGEATSTSFRYSTETYTWVTLVPMPKAKCGHSVCVLDGLIYVMGGDDTTGILGSVHRFDPAANSWNAVAPMSVARGAFCAFVLNGSIHVVGGQNSAGRVKSMERYCVASDSWANVRGGKIGQKKGAFGATVMRLEVNIFDSLVAKAKLAALVASLPPPNSSGRFVLKRGVQSFIPHIY